jgi:hypothetical protein
MLTYFGVIQGHLAEIGALGKMLIALERNKLASSALRRSIEKNFLYRTVRLQVKIQRTMALEYRLQNVKQTLT